MGKDVPQSGLAGPGDKALSNALLLLCFKIKWWYWFCDIESEKKKRDQFT
jgi:hypothetical protein